MISREWNPSVMMMIALQLFKRYFSYEILAQNLAAALTTSIFHACFRSRVDLDEESLSEFVNLPTTETDL